jgi:hypothetical protein
MKLGERVRVNQDCWPDRHPDLDCMKGQTGTISEVNDPIERDLKKRMRYEVKFDKPQGSREYTAHFPFYEDQLTLLPYHRWPRSYGGWQAGSIIRCEGDDCQWCASRWTLVDPLTLEDVTE